MSPDLTRAVQRLAWAPSRAPNLPQLFDGQEIKFRIPYSMPGELAVDITANVPPFSTQFPAATFLHNVDKPFEIHRVIPRITLLTTVSAVDFVVLSPTGTDPITGFEKLVHLRIDDTSKNEKWTKAPQLISDMVNKNTGVWELECPYTIVRSEGFNVEVDVQRFSPNPFLVSVPAGSPTLTTINKIRVDLTFEGYLVVIAPPSETR